MPSHPYITLADAVEEISLRTGCSLKNTHSVLNCFFEIVQESMMAGVDVRLKGLGAFSFRDNVPMRNVTMYDPKQRKRVFFEETQGYRIPKFRFSEWWRAGLKEATLVTYDEVFGDGGEKQDE